MDIKLKNKILVVGFIVVLFIIYEFAISKTIETNKIVSQLTIEKSLLKNVSNKILDLKTKEAQLDAILKKRNISISNSFQQMLLQNVTSFAQKNELQIIAFSEPHTYNTNITRLATYSFEIKGSFISLLKMICFLEELQLGKLLTIKFEKKNNYRNNTNYLTCKILLQKSGN